MSLHKIIFTIFALPKYTVKVLKYAVKVLTYNANILAYNAKVPHTLASFFHIN